MNRALFTWLGSIFLSLAAVPLRAGEEPHAHAPSSVQPFGWDLGDHWLDPWDHRHFSGRGTPYIHHFGFEPAYTGRDLLASYGWAELEDGEEQEVELELEWALTRRLGVVLEQGYIFEDPDGESSVDGWGDLAIVPRALLAEFDCFLATLNLEVEVPTGSDDVGAGEEWHLAPSLSTWADLGGWWTVSTNTGLEFALDSEETEFFFTLGLAKAIRVREGAVDGHHDHHAGHHHHTESSLAGILSVVAELTGEVVLDGEEDEEDEWVFEALFGLNYAVSEAFDLRFAYRLPLQNSELEHGLQGGFIFHF